MKIQHEFTVARPIAEVWEFFLDVPAVAACLPGAELTGDKGEGQYAGMVSVKLGPMTATFEGEATVRPDPATHSASISGKGVDKRGGSRGQVKVDYALEEGDGATKVTIDADVMLSGPAAQFGRTGLINEISKRLIGEFVECLEAKLGASTPEEAAEVRARSEVSGISLFFAGLWSWLRRLIGRGE